MQNILLASVRALWTGISYLLEADDPSATCTTCPAVNKFELFNN